MTPRVLVTRAPDQAATVEAALEQLGIEAVVVPAIAVEVDPRGGTLDAAARLLHTFDTVVITSTNGARAILTAAERVFTALETPRWAAIGRATADVLEREGIAIDFRPSQADAATLAEELPVRHEEEVLLVRGDLAGDGLGRRLRERGAAVTDVVAYRTVVAPASSRGLLRRAIAAGHPAAVVFASASAVRGLVALATAEQVQVTAIPAVCIGPETAGEATRLGFEDVAVAPTPDPADLAATAVGVLAWPVETR